jgi:fatty acid CoA ligase FadD32
MALGSLLPELVEGPARSPLIGLLAKWAAEKPDAPAFTFVDYSANPKGLKITIDWTEAYRRARAMAVRLRQTAEPGDRVALLLPQSLEYMMAMLGAMYSHVIAVPLFSPDLPGHADRLIRAYADAAPTVIVTVESALPYVQKFLDDHDVPQPKEVILAESVDSALAADWVDEPIDLDEVAYLQYTSGSTRAPAGVEITHGNVNANARQLWGGFTGTPGRSMLVSWLPLFHDMGLIATMALPLVYGNHAVYTAPLSFVMNPLRWLQLISEYEDVYTAAPNFAYEYVTERATDANKAGLDLSRLRGCLNGAEPIRPATLKNFYETFASAGLREYTQGPGYGLAEATVFVTADCHDVPPTILSVDRAALMRGTMQVVEAESERSNELVGCGAPVGQFVAIVDPETCVEQPDDQVGEIWVHGPNVAPGYWKNSERSQDVFGGMLADPAEGVPEGPWMRTGDFGVIHDGALFVTGRIKDLIIVDGRNHYPQDLEVTAQEAHPAIRPDHVAAFPVPGRETEQLVIVAERNRRVPLAQLDLAEVEERVRTAVNLEHEMRVHDFVLIEPGGISKTSSGKIARAATRQRHLAGELPTTGARLSARG